jgi:hypothetical protein
MQFCTIRLIESIWLYWTCEHVTLMTKLYWYGVCGIPHKLIGAYLTSRTQQVKVTQVADNQLKEYLSSSLPVRYGVPQGSVLVPLLSHFICKWCTTPNTR